jgi:diacylglycerol kinase family enzyme
VDALGRSLDGRRPGDLAFVREAWRTIAAHGGRFGPALEIEGFGRAAFVLVANSQTYTYAGAMPLRVAPKAQWELGLDLVAPVAVRKRRLLRLIRYVALGRGQERARDVIYGHDLDRIEVHCDRPMALQADGEDLGDVEHAVFEAERDAVAVLL